MQFTYNEKDFILDGKSIKIYAGAIHYFRVPHQYWYDRLLKLKECGFNAVETYVAWNLHERKEGVFNFSDDLDIGNFIDTAKELGLLVIVRPGPYICAEWEGGGLPSWLLKYSSLKIRCSNACFLEKTENFFARLFEILRPRLASNGGNIVMMQVENEYGSYGNDKEYLLALVRIFRKYDMNCILFTGDGAEGPCLALGSLPGILACATFGSKVVERMTELISFRPNQPQMCIEFWCGWFDMLYEQHHTREVEDICNNVEEFLKGGYNFNFYMFCGGTNFGFMNGANLFGLYRSVVTSYDYNALLTEAGDRTEAYYRVRGILKKYGVSVPELTAKETKKCYYGKIKFTQHAKLFSNLKNLSVPVHSAHPLTMEECGQDFGYILYSTGFPACLKGCEIEFQDLHDRANIFVNGKEAGKYERGLQNCPIVINFEGEEDARLDILVENMGRIHFWENTLDRKGLCRVVVSHKSLFGYNIYPLNMEDLSHLQYEFFNNNTENEVEETTANQPCFYRGEFQVNEIGDTYVRPSGFSKGFIVVNGRNIGRFYNAASPQKTLYLPACFLKKGNNEIIIFDSDGPSELDCELTDDFILKNK